MERDTVRSWTGRPYHSYRSILMRGSLGMGTAHGRGSRLTHQRQGVEHCTLENVQKARIMYVPRAVLASSTPYAAPTPHSWNQ